MWSWGRAGTGTVDTTDRWLQLKRHGFPVIDRGSPRKCESGYQITALLGLQVPEVRLGLCRWRLVGLGFELGWIAWQKLIKPGLLQLWTSWWLWCLCTRLTPAGGQSSQERGVNSLEIGGIDGCFWKTPWRWHCLPQNRTVCFGSRRDGSLTLQRHKEEKRSVRLDRDTISIKFVNRLAVLKSHFCI